MGVLAVLALPVVALAVIMLKPLWTGPRAEARYNRRALRFYMRARRRAPKACPKHFKQLKVGQMAILDIKGCGYCAKSVKNQ